MPKPNGGGIIGGRSARQTPLLLDGSLEKERKKKKSGAQGGQSGGGATASPVARKSYRKIGASKDVGGEVGGTQWKFKRTPPQEHMYEVDPGDSPRLFKWLIDNGHVEPVSSYRTVSKRATQRGARNRK